MKVIIAGSRCLDNICVIEKAIELSNFKLTEIVSGTARGVDQLGEAYAKQRLIPVKRFPADWDRYGKSAGYRRNEQMAQYADALVAVWDGESRGTKHMIDIMKMCNKPVFVYTKGAI